MDDFEQVAEHQPEFSRFLGIRITSASADLVTAEMPATGNLANRNGVLHGGAIMGFADNLGGTAATINLRPGQATTTVESKTNFIRPIHIGDTVHGRCVPLHKGHQTMIWQTTITRADGRTAAIVIQTQMILEWRESAPEPDPQARQTDPQTPARSGAKP